MRVFRSGRLLLPAALALLSCSDPTGPRTPTSILVVGGAGQSARVASVLPQPVVVEVKDVDGKVVRGAVVTWSVSSGGGSVSAATSTTNRSGRAEVQWTLGTTAGENRLSAGVPSVSPTSVTATAEAGAPTSMTVVFGNGQTGLAGHPLSDPVVVRVLDSYGNGVSGIGVAFTPGTGTVAPPSAVTDGTGAAFTTWGLGSDPGQHTLEASAAGLAGAVSVSATSLALSDVQLLENGVEVAPLDAGEGSNRYFRIVVPAQTTRLSFRTTGGPGDVDLFVRGGRLPSTRSFECRSITPTGDESCVIQTPSVGDWFVLLDAYTSYSNVTLRASYVIGGSMNVTVTGLPAGVPGSVSVDGGGRNRVLSATTSIPGMDPGSYTIRANHVLYNDVVYAGTPEVQQVDVTAGGAYDVAVAYAASSGGLNLDITGAYITQSVQRTDGSIPLIAGRDGLLRVFARGNAINTATPGVRARFYQGGTLVDSLMIAAPAASVPINHNEGVLTTTWNAVVPGAWIQPGLSVLVDVDPTDQVAEPDEADNRYPESGTPLVLDVRPATTMQARLVPVLQSTNSLQGDVTPANAASYVTKAQALYPLPAIDVDVRATYTFSGTLASQYDSIWGRLLGEILALRAAEGSARFYYGVIKPAYTQGGTGLGYIGLPAALGVEWPNWRDETLAHEWGHNFGRYHVACGNPANPDPDYPYAGGKLGHNGYDIRTNEIRPLDTHHDLLSYCQPTWVSDYTYEAVRVFREAHPGPSGAAQPSLLVWGRITPEGVVLEPAFEVMTRPVLPAKGGAYRVTGTDSKGSTVLDISFDGYEIDHMPEERHFAYAIPLRSMGGAAPRELRLTGGGADAVRREALPAITAGGEDLRVTRAASGRVRVQWNAARNPVVMVRDPRTGEVLSFARGGDTEVATNAAEVEVNMSDGVRSTARRVVVSR